MRDILCGRRSIRSCWRNTSVAPRIVTVAPRIVNDVSYVTRINHSESFCFRGRRSICGEVQVSRFVAGAAFRETWNDSWSAKCCIFQYKMLAASATSSLGCEAGCGVTVSWSDHGRIGLGSWSDRSRIVNDNSPVLEKFL